jgi:hypothetical protein
LIRLVLGVSHSELANAAWDALVTVPAVLEYTYETCACHRLAQRGGDVEGAASAARAGLALDRQSPT